MSIHEAQLSGSFRFLINSTTSIFQCARAGLGENSLAVQPSSGTYLANTSSLAANFKILLERRAENKPSCRLGGSRIDCSRAEPIESYEIFSIDDEDDSLF